MQLIKVTLIFFLSGLLTGDSIPAKWTLKKYQNGIAVYTRMSESSTLKEVRCVNTVHSSLSAIVALLKDADNCPEWIYACSESKILKMISNTEQYQYLVTDVPMPFSDRDIVTDQKITQDPKTKVVTIKSMSMPKYYPVQENRVRVEDFHSQYTLTPLADGNVYVEFELYVDPGGAVPAWLVNMNIVRGPFNTTVAMLDQLKKSKYSSAHLPFIDEKE
jgi:hypothetical protein